MPGSLLQFWFQLEHLNFLASYIYSFEPLSDCRAGGGKKKTVPQKGVKRKRKGANYQNKYNKRHGAARK